jgi:acetyltransferase-like isoleucine patch superfamily enzyme
MKFLRDIFKLYYTRNSRIHKFSEITRFCRIVDSEIDKYSYVGVSTVIRNARVGKFCSIAQNVKIGAGEHPINLVSTSPVFYTNKNEFNFSFFTNNSIQERKKTFIANDVLIGANVFIRDGIKIGNGAIIGANSFVNRDVLDYEIVGGVPARHLKFRFEKLNINRLLEDKWWDWEIEKIKKNEEYFTKRLQ